MQPKMDSKFVPRAEADFINKALNGRPCLDFVGGQISLEMELPKILWIKRHLPEVYKKATLFMDLCDFLTWRATNNTARSICSVVCKWLYQVDPKKPKETGWDSTILQSTELGELAENLFDKIGTSIVNPGTRLPHGVSTKAAEELGLLKGTPVATGLIDANAGALALAFCSRPGREIHNPFTRLAIICGTSSCFMICQEQPAFVPGVWGPYHSAIIPNAWATEGGQVSLLHKASLDVQMFRLLRGDARNFSCHRSKELTITSMEIPITAKRKTKYIYNMQLQVWPNYLFGRNGIVSLHFGLQLLKRYD